MPMREPGQVRKEAALTADGQCRGQDSPPFARLPGRQETVSSTEPQGKKDAQGAHRPLALEWRPRGFADVVGQDPVVKALRGAVTGDRSHHAYLLSGTRGVGKTTIARILAKSFNCTERGRGDAEPCQECGSCREIDGSRHPDVLEMDAASHTQVDNIREILETAVYSPSSGKYRVFIIDEVHMLSRSAFNAMLKTLEEPPGHVKFVLATTDPQRLPATVLSRCLQFNLKRIRPEAIRGRLARILGEEKVGHDEAVIGLVAEQADGSLRDALTLLDQVLALGGGTATAEGVSEIFGLAGDEAVERALRAIADGDYPSLHATVGKLDAEGRSFDDLLSRLASRLHRIALGNALPEDPEAAGGADPGIGTTQAHVLYEIAVNARRTMPHGPDPRTAAEMALLRMAWFAGENPVAEHDAVPAGREAAPPGPAAGRRPAPAPAEHPAEDLPAGLPGSADDWAALVPRMGGMARSAAKACSFDRADGNRVFLKSESVSASKAGLVAQELTRLCGRTVKVEIAEGATDAPTPRQVQDADDERRRAADIDSVRNDPEVRQVLDEFPGAAIAEHSIATHDGGREGP